MTYSGRRIALPMTLLLGALAVGLGYWGYQEAQPGIGALDALYRAIVLLALEYSGPEAPPWQLQLARYLAVVAVASAIIAVVASVARERADRLRARLIARRHHVVVGLGERGLAVARNLRADGKPVVAVDRDSAGSGTVSARAEGLAVVIDDPRSARAYRDSATRRAKHVLICLGNDSANLESLEEALAAISGPGPGFHVAIDDQLLWRELHCSALSWSGPGRMIEFVSLADRVASIMVEQADRHRTADRIVIWGAGPKAERTAAHAVRRALLEDRRPELILAGPRAADLDAALWRGEPWIHGCADTTATTQPPSGKEHATAFVVGVDHAEVLAGASILVRELGPTATVLAEVSHATAVGALGRSGFPVERVRFVDAEAQVLGRGLFEDSTRELLARARHSHYLDQEQRRGDASGQNPSLLPWEELPEPLRESNRLFADSMGACLARLGGRLEPLAGPVQEAQLSDELVEELARVEHDRWAGDLRSRGWHSTSGAKDPERKLHPLLVDWNDLDNAEQEKDRESIRALPDFLARVGYELRVDA